MHDKKAWTVVEVWGARCSEVMVALEPVYFYAKNWSNT